MTQGCIFIFFTMKTLKSWSRSFHWNWRTMRRPLSFLYLLPWPKGAAERLQGILATWTPFRPLSEEVMDDFALRTTSKQTRRFSWLLSFQLCVKSTHLHVDTKQIEYRHVGRVHPDWTRYCLVWLFWSYALTHLPAEKHNGQLSISSTLPAWHIHFCIIHYAFKSYQLNVYVNTEHSTNIRLSITSN